MKRSSYLWFNQEVTINKAGLKLWGYDTDEKFVCRLEINATGLEIFSGEKGGKQIVT